VRELEHAVVNAHFRNMMLAHNMCSPVSFHSEIYSAFCAANIKMTFIHLGRKVELWRKNANMYRIQ